MIKQLTLEVWDRLGLDEETLDEVLDSMYMFITFS